MFLGFDVVADDDRIDTVVADAGDDVVKDDDLDGVDANDVNATDDVTGIDDCEIDELATTYAVTDEVGAAVVDAGVDCDSVVPVGGWSISTLKYNQTKTSSCKFLALCGSDKKAAYG